MSRPRWRVRWANVISAVAVAATIGCGGNGGGRPLPVVGGQSAGSNGAADLLQSSVLRDAVATTAYQSLVESANPSAYFPLADATSTLSDSVAGAPTGVYGSEVNLQGANFAARSGAAAVFPGGNSYRSTAVASVPMSTSLQPAQLSVEAWITPSSANTTGTFVPIVSYGCEYCGQPYVLQVSPQNVMYFYSKSTSGYAAAEQGLTKLLTGQSYHVAATDDGVELKLYVNGKLETTVRAAGPPSYSNLNGAGLTIGGAAESTNRAIFNGTIDDVGIYPTVLSPSTVAAHYVAGSSTTGWPYESETPLSADGFVDSFALVTHLHYQNSPYDLQFERVKSLLVQLGVRHINDCLCADNWQPYKDRLEELAQAGIHSTLGTDTNTTPAQVVNYPALVPGSMEAVEGYNEPELFLYGDKYWAAQTIAWQKLLYQTVKSNAATSKLAVLGPAVVSYGANLALGDLSQWMDYGNSHMYWSALNPETPGFGGTDQWGKYGSISWYLGYESVMSGSRPHRITETGWGTGTGYYENSPATQAKYLARLYLDLYGRGVDRSAMYEFVDGHDGGFGWYGLVDYNVNPKPSFYEMKSLIGLLGDPGSTFSPTGKFDFHLAGSTSNVNHLLMQKRNGKDYLAIWLGVQSCNPNPPSGGPCADEPIRPQVVTLSTQQTPSAARWYTFDSNGNMFNGKLSFANNTTVLTVTDQVSVVELDP